MAEQFINTFSGGMNSDYNVILQPEGTYRFASNCQIVSQDGNNYVIKDTLGNVRTININIRYGDSEDELDIPPMVIGIISFPDKAVVFSTNNETEEGGYGEIGIIKYLPYGEGIQPLTITGAQNNGYVPLYHHNDLKFSKLHRIEGFGLKETENIERVYWTDNYNEPRVFNIADSIFTDYYSSGDALAIGDEVMVLEGIVEYPPASNDFYGPTTGTGNIIGNIITAAVASTLNFVSSAPTAKAIRYYPVQLLNWAPDRLLGGIQMVSYGAGNVYCGNKIYFYRLGLNSGYVTPWSYPSAPTHVGITEPLYPTAYNYTNQVGAGSSALSVRSSKSLNISIDHIDETFDYIEMACAEFNNINDVPTDISIVAKSDITSDTMILTHTGSQNYGNLTIADITLFPVTILKCKTLATNKNYLLIGNIQEREEIDVDFSGVTITSFNYPMSMLNDAITCSNAIIYEPEVPPTSGNPIAGTVTPNSRWLVTRGEATVNTVSYNGSLYLTGQVITALSSGAGVNNKNSIACLNAGAVKPCVTRNRYTPFGTSERRENAIPLVGDTLFWDYKSAVVHQHCQGYWSNEKYRYGILLYDKKGNPQYVRWIGDYTFPNVISKGGLFKYNDYEGGTNNYYSLNPSGVKFSNILIPDSIIDEISGFSIVRAPRDARIICQGLVNQTFYDPLGSITGTNADTVYIDGWWYTTNAGGPYPYEKVYGYISPDILVDASLKGSLGSTGDTVESAGWVQAVGYTGGFETQGYGGEEQVVTKFILNPQLGTPDTITRTGNITFFANMEEQGSIVNFNNTTKNLYNVGFTGIDTEVNGICLAPVFGYDLDGRGGVGGKKSFFMLDADFLYYGIPPPGSLPNDGYTGIIGSQDKRKVMMNYCKPNPNQYGGVSDNALASTAYITTGHFQPINATVKSETYNGAGFYVFNNVEVFGGDCFVNYIDYAAILWSSEVQALTTNGTFSHVYTFPCECNANYALRSGRKTSNIGMYFTNDHGTDAGPQTIIHDGSVAESRLEEFAYNKAYSSEGISFLYPALPENLLTSGRFESRIRYAGPKFLGEIIDSFRRFLINDYKDLDTWGGEINNIKTKDGRIFIWQNKIMSTVPILERQILSGLDGAATTLGTGGVVDRYDYLTSYFGNQHQWSLIETEYGYAWFDMRRKAFMVVGLNSGGILEESQIGGLSAFFNEVFLERVGASSVSTNLINDPNFAATSDRPLVGVGITGVYDPKFKMTYMTFKFSQRTDVLYFCKDFTIGYLHTPQLKCFVSFYDGFAPAISHNHNQFVISVNDPKNTTKYLRYSGGLSGLSFVVGETLPLDGVEYICILNVTTGDANTLPGFPGSIYWRAINAQNQLWVHNQPHTLGLTTAPDYAYNTFFGKVVNNEIDIIVNPKAGDQFEVTNIEQVGNLTNFTDIYYESSNGQTASDTTITTTNRNYRPLYGNSINSSAPLGNTGRLVGNYTKIRFFKKNWITDPAVVSLSVKLFEYLKSFFVQKR